MSSPAVFFLPFPRLLILDTLLTVLEASCGNAVLSELNWLENVKNFKVTVEKILIWLYLSDIYQRYHRHRFIETREKLVDRPMARLDL